MESNAAQLVREMQRRAEQRLQAQQDIALAADARALTFCGLCLTAASLLIGLADGEMRIPMYAAGGYIYVGAALAAYAARPTSWAAPGQPSDGYAEDLRDDRPIIEVISEVNAHIDDQILRNEKKLSENALIMRIAAATSVLSPLVGLAAYLMG
ncbi:hypothetical protein QCN27_17740 [Cereibacter sp. SYSU M97828]|nr:hypothetical protein [Cereibacter flavus]